MIFFKNRILDKEKQHHDSISWLKTEIIRKLMINVQHIQPNLLCLMWLWYIRMPTTHKYSKNPKINIQLCQGTLPTTALPEFDMEKFL